MRLSNRIGAASAALAALVLAACAGHSSLPSTITMPGPNAVAAKATPGPCKTTQAPWVFGGPCGAALLTSKGGSGKLATYGGFSVSATFSSGNPAPRTYLAVHDAIPGRDISGTVARQTFPALTKYGQLTLTPILYLKAQNTGAAFTFNETPDLVITSTKPFLKFCFLSKLVPPAGKVKTYAWLETAEVAGRVKGNTLTFPSFPQPQVVPARGTLYLGIACTNQ